MKIKRIGLENFSGYLDRLAELDKASVQQNPVFGVGRLNLAKSLYESGLFARAGAALEQLTTLQADQKIEKEIQYADKFLKN